MPVVIRLARGGSAHRPKYRIAVADSRRFRDGKFLDILGYYNPAPQGQDKEYVVNLEKLQDWQSKGAQLSDRVRDIVKKAQKVN